MNSQPTNPILVYSPKTLAKLLGHLRRQPMLALDTESDSLYSYYPRVCLIQISVAAAPPGTDEGEVTDYLVDPLRLTDLTPLGEILADPGVEVVMHAADNDMLLLYRQFGFTFRRIFDTQLTARILGWEHAGLAAILEEHFGIVSDKRMQRTNWGKRPLMPQQIAYAQMDTHYLLPLRHLQIEELKRVDRWEEAQEAFAQLAATDFAAHPVEERTFWQMKTLREVPERHLGVLEALWNWREHEARRLNRPSFKVLSDAALVNLATRMPRSLAELAEVRELGDTQTARYGGTLLAVIVAGQAQPLPHPPPLTPRPEALADKVVQTRFELLRKWRSAKAKVRGVMPDIVLTNSVLLEIAQRNPRSAGELGEIPEVGPWKVRTYGPEILALLGVQAVQASPD
jgi:ribonuclease D